MTRVAEAGRPAALSRVVVGRQSIVRADRTVVGYELLFRSVEGHGPDGSGALTGDEFTSEVLFGTVNIGLGALAGDRRVWVNADRGILTGRCPLVLPPERSVIEVLETVRIDAEVLDGCRRLREQGYVLALDDFTWFPGADALLELAGYVKLDLQALGGERLAREAERCRGFDVGLLAEKIETEEQFDAAQRLGFELYQGFLLERPSTVSSRSLGSSELARLRLGALLLDDDADIDRLEAIMRTEPAITYQLMQLASLGRLGESRRRIRSLRHAIVVSGTRRVRSWLALLLARPAGRVRPEATTLVLARARACELLAAQYLPAEAESAFAAGMLSAFDVLLDVPADVIFRDVPLAADLRAAAFGDATPLGRLVRTVAQRQMGTSLGSGRDAVPSHELDLALTGALSWAMSAGAVLAPEAAPQAGPPGPARSGTSAPLAAGA